MVPPVVAASRCRGCPRRAAGTGRPSGSRRRCGPARARWSAASRPRPDGDFQAPVHRAGVHDDGVFQAQAVQGAEPVVVEAPAARVFAGGREEGGVHPFALDAQHHHGVDALGEGLVQVVADIARPLFDADRQQCRRRDQGDLGAEGAQQPDVGAGHPGVQDVPGDRDPHPLEVRPADGVPASLDQCRRIVKASSSAWVGCSWVPSPALMTAASIQSVAASRCGAPEAQCRMTTASAPIADSVWAVSLRDSPLETDEPLAAKLMTSAESRLAAASKEMRVRVESSKKRFTQCGRAGRGALDLTVPHGRHLSACEDADGVGEAQVLGGGRCSMPRPAMTTSLQRRRRRAVLFSQAGLGLFGGGGGEVLSHVVARMGSSRWPRSISTARLTRSGGGQVDLASRADPWCVREIQDVVDEHRRPCCRCRCAGAGWGTAARWAGGKDRRGNMVTSNWPTIAAASTVGSAAGAILQAECQRVTRRGMPAGEVPGALVGLEIHGRMRVRARSMSAWLRTTLVSTTLAGTGAVTEVNARLPFPE